MQETRHS